ncbi:MAG: HmuY family protein [Bacteroidales bacterium]|nr:HmuY family protein [Bacteroidales bacterium]
MTRLILISTVILPLLFLTACFKEDEKVTPHLPGNTLVDTVELTNLYKYQVFYELNSATSVGSSLRKQWDIAFESSPEGWHIRLNTSCFMYAAAFPGQEFGIMADTTNASWKFDNSNGDADSLAIGKWFTVNGNDTVSNGNLLIVNRGIDELGNDRGYRQLIIDSLSGGIFYFRTAKFNGSDQKSYVLNKVPGSNYSLFSFDTGVSPLEEPPSNAWDLMFTQYTTLLYTDLGEPYPYLVTGVLMNPVNVSVARDTSHTFSEITIESVEGLQFSNQQDFIGYDWKYYDFDTGSYTVDLNKIYVIRDNKGFLYKLRFLGFYNNLGEKGFPSFEFQRL